jgi:hypothetical protein
MPYSHDQNVYLHNPDSGKNYSGAMARSRFHRMADMATELDDLLADRDELPAWTQDFIATSHDRLAQVYSYLEPKAARARAAKIPGAPTLSDIARAAQSKETLAETYLRGSACIGEEQKTVGVSAIWVIASVVGFGAFVWLAKNKPESARKIAKADDTFRSAEKRFKGVSPFLGLF